jgi:hypothetical protein
MNRASHLFDFARLRNCSALLLSGTLVCLGCLTQFEHPQVVAKDLKVCKWGVIESGRLADWSAQLPAGEGRREGIIGFAVV